MLKLVYTARIKRDAKRMSKRGKDMMKLDTALRILVTGKALPEPYKDHPLKGEYKDFRECHLEPDWLLIYRIDEDRLILFASGTGTHADLFSE
ncbi:MAG: type II toxin-antitoxin system YafQ family toxin [Clostridiales Family XIII bacterium]|jgi:mRNA interferase YafQ|nr:type II toxin-antitoxin system YafQ family toxin [Clostridiales Family XIII bacterium]